MKKFAYAVFATSAALALAACGSSDNADEKANAESVEMPAEEAMSSAEAVPVEDASAAASAAATTAADAGAADTGASAAAEAATQDAEKKM